jgi:AcrR family transcriptional regulator
MQPRGRPVTLSDDALLDAARDVFVERGLEATTSEIARRARISESVIFYRYKTKEALFTAVFERELVLPPGFKKLVWRAGMGEVADNLFDAGMGLVELSERTLPFMMMACVSPTKLNVLAKHAKQPHPVRQEMLGALTLYFDAEMQGGRLRPVQSEILARTFLGGIVQYVMSAHMAPPPSQIDPPTFLRGVIDVLLHGVVEAPIRPRTRVRKRR